jgi:hypothetical protein
MATALDGQRRQVREAGPGGKPSIPELDSHGYHFSNQLDLLSIELILDDCADVARPSVAWLALAPCYQHLR